MKKKLITIFSLCATLVLSLCSVGMKKASASEEVYSNNLYSSISYRRYIANEETQFDKDFTGSSSDELVTNLMKIEDNEKDLLISMKFKLSNTNYKQDTFSVTGLWLSGMMYFDNYMGYNNSAYFKVYDSTDIKFEGYKLDSSGEYLIYNILYPNPKNTDTGTKAEFFTVYPTLAYKDNSNNSIRENGKSISEMYVSFIERDTITSSDDLMRANIDYTPYTSGFTWDCTQVSIDSNYLGLKVSEKFDINTVVEAIKVTNENGEICSLNYGSIQPETVHLQGFKYQYIIHAYDKNGKHDFLLVSLNIVDNESPVINGSSEYTVPNGSLLSVNAIKNTLIISDNKDTIENIQVLIKYDYYTSNYENPGIYYVCFTATDTSGNSSDFIVKINVTDKNAPVFYDEYNIQRTKCTVYKSIDSVLVMSDIISKYKAIDEVDGELEIKVHSDKYTGNGETPGKYTVVLKAVDSSKNVTYFSVTIVVSEEMPSKTILINEKYIIVEKSVKLTKANFNDIIRLLGTYNPNTTSYTTISSEIYSSSYNEVGEYLVEYNIVTTSGYETNEVFSVSVVNSRTGGSVINEKEKEDGVIVSFFKWLWDLIVSFFEWIGSLFV